MKNQISSDRYTSQRVDQTDAVYDLLVPQAFHINPMVQPNVLFCVEISKRSVETGIFDTIISHIHSNLDSIDYDANIGIIIYNS